MHWKEFELLEEVGLTGYERKALVTLMIHGVADAETLCRKGEVPSSKIYQAMEKLGQMGFRLVDLSLGIGDAELGAAILSIRCFELLA